MSFLHIFDFISTSQLPFILHTKTSLIKKSDSVDLGLVLDNQAAYRMCKENLKVKAPSFLHLNRIIAQMVSATTTSLRFETQLNATLDEIVTNIVPEPKMRYPIMSLSPVRHPSRAKHENFSTTELVTSLFDETNFLADVGTGMLKKNRYLSCCVLLRGVDRIPAADLSDHLASLPGGSAAADGKVSGEMRNDQNQIVTSVTSLTGVYIREFFFNELIISSGIFFRSIHNCSICSFLTLYC